MASSFSVRRAIAIAAYGLTLASCGPAENAGDAAPATGTAGDAQAAQPASSSQDLLEATVIHWSVVGDFAGEVLVLNAGTNGWAPATDHVEFAYDFTLEGNTGLTGTPTFSNFPSTMGALRNGAEGCRAPTITPPPYEHWTIEKIEQGLGGTVAVTVRTDYPEGQVPVACTGGNQRSPARVQTNQVDLAIPSVALLTMGDLPAGMGYRLSSDRRSLIVEQNGWTFVYTPSRVR